MPRSSRLPVQASLGRGHVATSRAVSVLVDDPSSVTPGKGILLVARTSRTGIDRCLFGAPAALTAHRHKQTSMRCLVLLDPPEAVCDRVVELEGRREHTLSWHVDVATLFREIGMSIADVADVLGVSRGHAQRLARMGLRPALVRNRALAGGITEGHLRYLGALSDADFASMVERTLRERLSVRELARALREHQRGMTDAALKVEMDDYASRISEALGTAVEIRWPDDIEQRGVSIAWYGIEQLQGILERLGGSAPAQPRMEKRSLFLALRDTSETDAIFGRLAL